MKKIRKIQILKLISTWVKVILIRVINISRIFRRVHKVWCIRVKVKRCFLILMDLLSKTSFIRTNQILFNKNLARVIHLHSSWWAILQKEVIALFLIIKLLRVRYSTKAPVIFIIVIHRINCKPHQDWISFQVLQQPTNL